MANYKVEYIEHVPEPGVFLADDVEDAAEAEVVFMEEFEGLDVEIIRIKEVN